MGVGVSDPVSWAPGNHFCLLLEAVLAEAEEPFAEKLVMVRYSSHLQTHAAILAPTSEFALISIHFVGYQNCFHCPGIAQFVGLMEPHVGSGYGRRVPDYDDLSKVPGWLLDLPGLEENTAVEELRNIRKGCSCGFLLWLAIRAD